MSRSRRRGVVLFLVFAVLLLASASASVFAAEPESEPAESEGTVLQEAITPPGAEQIQEASEAADRREAERLEWLSGPEATQEREQSRSAFSGIGAADAQALLMDVFATEFAQLNAEPARQLSDAQLLSTSGETVATVRDDGKTFLLDAAIPVRDENEDGELRKVDLSLEESAQGFEPVNPLTSGLVVPDSAVEPIELGDEGLEIKPLGVEDRDAQHLDDQTVYYNAVLPDVGYMVAPIAGGVELFNALYSPNSPEALHYELELPDRAELKPDGNGGAEIVRDQKTLAYIPFPTAVDAQGTRVPVDMEIDGSTLSLHVPHREGDFAYPILVDPAIVEDYEWHWSGGASLEALGLWTYSTNDPTQTYLLRDGSACIRTDWCLPSGRGIYMTAVPHNYPANVYGQFFYWAPGATTYIPSVWTPENPALSAWINPFWRSNHGCSQSQYPNPRDYNGSFDVNGNWLWYEQDRAQWYGNAGMVTKAKGIAFGMTTAGGGYVPCPRSILVGGYGVRLDDEDAPTISNASVPAGWVGDLANFNVTATAADGSLGVHRIRITPNGRGFFELSLGCSGTATNRCPNSISNRPFSVNGNNFNEGERGVQFAALDPTGEPVSNTIEKTIKIDNTPPQITLPPSQLATATAEVGSVEKPAGNGNELELPFYNLVIEAKDYESGAGPSEKRSGVKNVEIYVDNVKKPVPWTAQTCTTSGCPRAMNVTYPLKTTELQSSGDHILKVVAVDQVGEKLTREIEFEYFPATGMKEEYVLHHFPLPDDQGNEAEEEHPRRPELAVNVMNGNLIYRETDIDVESSAGIDLKVDRYYNSLLPDSENTEWGDGWTLGQTPKLDPIPVQEGSPVKARLLRTSAAYQTNVPLPAGEGQTQFDPGLAAVVTMQADGDYEISDATGESSSTAMAFDDDGRMKELQGAGYSRAVYGYDEGKLATIDVTDPATFSANPAELQIEPRAVPSFKAAIGSVGTGNGQMQSPSDVAIDAAGNTWVLEKANNRVQKFNANGEFVSKFGSAGAGNGQFNWPAALAIDVKGNIWIADRGNRRVQKFNANGEYLSRFGSAGTGNGQFAGAGPEGIAIDQKGNIWVSDTYGGRLQKFTEAGAFLKAAGSKGSAPGQLGEPTGIDVGPAGNVWVADWQNHRVSVFNEAGEFVRQFGTQGSGDGKFANPDAIDVDSQGNVWVGDQNNDRIQQFDEEGNFVAKFGSKGSGQGQFEFAYPMGITTDAKGALWVADPDNNRVQRFQIPHYLPAYRSSVGAAGAGDGQLNLPSDVAFDSKANLWVADSGNNRIQGFDAGSGEFVSKFGTAGSGDGQLSAPASLAVDANGDIWVADKNNSRVQKFNAQGEFLAKFGSQGSGNGQLNRPEGIAIDAAGNIWVSDTYNHRIQKFKPNGEFLAVVSPAGLGTIEPTGIDAGPGGKVWVTDWTNNRVVVLSESGELIRQFGTAGSGAGQFNHPDAIEVDAQGKVWVGDEGNGRIQQFNQYGELVAIFGAKGSGAGQFSFSYPFGVAAAAGRLWIADRNNNRIQRWEAADLTPTEINVKVNGDNDPSVELDSEGGLIASIEGIEAGEHSYAYNGQFLVSHNGPEGEIAYEKDPTTGQLKKVTLPNGTYGQIAYRSDGRVLSVTVAPEGSDPKTTTFEYTDAAPTTEARSTRVVPPDAPAVTYDIGADGSVFRWRHVPQAPQFLDLDGSIWTAWEEQEPLAKGDHLLKVTADHPEGIDSIKILANGIVVSEKACAQDPEKFGPECTPGEDEWLVGTYELPPGVLNLEVIITDSKGRSESERFWVQVPYTPPPSPEEEQTPRARDILEFREDYGLEVVFPVANESQLHERVLNLIGAWGNPNTPAGAVARASWERWGVPLRPEDVAEMEYREEYMAVNIPIIEAWATQNRPSTYAGYYVDHAAGGILHVGFTQDQSGALAQLAQQPGILAPGRLAAYAVPPTTARPSLQTTFEQAEAAWDSDSTLGSLVTGMGIDERSNTVEVTGTDPALIEGRLKLLLGSGAPIRAVYEPIGQEFMARDHIDGRIHAGDKTYRKKGGGAIGSCTAGFGAWDRIGTKPNGESEIAPFLMTAAHCGDPGQLFYRAKSNSEGAVNLDTLTKIGHVARTAFVNDGAPFETDAALVKLNGGGLMPRYIHMPGKNPKPVEEPGRPYPGETLCFSAPGGDVSKHPCGEYMGTRVRKTPNKRIVMVARFVGMPGDSGGPVWSPRLQKSVGIILGGPNDGQGRFKGWVTPLLVPRNHEFHAGKVPGALNAPGLGTFHLAVPGG